MKDELGTRLDAILSTAIAIACAALTAKLVQAQWPEATWLTYDRLVMSTLLVHVKYLRFSRQNNVEKANA